MFKTHCETSGLPSESLAMLALHTPPPTPTRKNQTPRDAATIGGAPVGGAILGRSLDDGEGDVTGGLLGAAAGTAAARQVVG